MQMFDPSIFRQALGRNLQRLWRNRLVRDGYWVLFGHLATILAGIVSIRLYTELAPQAVFGAANLLLGTLTLAMQTIIAPVTQTQVRFHNTYSDSGKGDTYLNFIARLAGCAALATSSLLCFILLIWPSLRLGAGPSVVVWLLGWILVSTYRNVSINAIQAERRQARYSAWLAAESGSQVLATWFFLMLSPQVESYVAGQLFGMLLPAAIFARRVPLSLTRTLNRDLRAEALLQLISYGLPFALLSLLGWISNLSDRYVLATQLDAAAVGRYVAAFGIASRFPSMLGGILTDIFRPALFEAENRSDRPRASGLFRQWLLVAALFGSFLVGVMFLAGDFLAEILLAESYRSGARTVMCWVALGYACVNLSQIIENRLLSHNASRILIVTKCCGAAANFAFANLLIPTLGVNGAACANALGQFLQLIACVLAALAYRHKHQPS